MLTWKDIINFTVNRNPTPDKTVIKTEDEWRAQLTSDQYKITRKKVPKRLLPAPFVMRMNPVCTTVFVAVPPYLILL